MAEEELTQFPTRSAWHLDEVRRLGAVGSATCGSIPFDATAQADRQIAEVGEFGETGSISEIGGNRSFTLARRNPIRFVAAT